MHCFDFGDNFIGLIHMSILTNYACQVCTFAICQMSNSDTVTKTTFFMYQHFSQVITIKSVLRKKKTLHIFIIIKLCAFKYVLIFMMAIL